MKKYIVLLLPVWLMFWVSSNGQASVYHPFPDSGAEWHVAEVDVQGCVFNLVIILFIKWVRILCLRV